MNHRVYLELFEKGFTIKVIKGKAGEVVGFFSKNDTSILYFKIYSSITNKLQVYFKTYHSSVGKVTNFTIHYFHMKAKLNKYFKIKFLCLKLKK